MPARSWPFRTGETWRRKGFLVYRQQPGIDLNYSYLRYNWIMTEFAILGAGAWGTAVGLVLAQNAEQHVTLWSARPEHAAALHDKRENVRLLPGVPIPPSVRLTTDIIE